MGVKGRGGLDIEVELTEAEYEFGRRAGEKCWLYVVYGVSTGKPGLLAIRDPVRRAGWEPVGALRYRLVGLS